jgi:PKD repeat protein
MKSDFGDIRFALNDGTHCPYWVESQTDGVSAEVWINIPAVSQSTFKMYYGKDTSTASDGVSTFEFFDDFTTATMDLTKWDANTGCTLSGGELTLAAGNGILSLSTYDLTTHSIRGRHKVNSTGVANGMILGLYSTGTYQAGFSFHLDGIWQPSLMTIQQSVGSIQTHIPSVASNTSYYISDVWKSGTTIYLTSTDSVGTTGSCSSSTYTDSNNNNQVLIQSYNTQVSTYDYVFVRHHTTTEPICYIEPSHVTINHNLKYSVTGHAAVTKSLAYDILYNAPDYSAWGHRLLLMITNPASIAGYQHKFELPYKAGMNADFSDIRFTQFGGQACPYWVETKTDSVTATVWFRTPNADVNIVYLYYENVVATSESDGEDVFDFFDDFEDGTIDTNKWTLTSTPTETGGELIITNGNAVTLKNSIVTKNLIVRVDAYQSSNLTSGYMCPIQIGATYTIYLDFNHDLIMVHQSVGTSHILPHNGYDDTTLRSYETNYNDVTDEWKFRWTSGAWTTWTGRTTTPTWNFVIYTGSGQLNAKLALMRKYVTTEPTIEVGTVYEIIPKSLTYHVMPVVKKYLSSQHRIIAQKRKTKSLTYVVVHLLTQSLTYKILHPYQDWAYDTITITDPVNIVNFQHKLDLVWHPTINVDFSDIRFMQLDYTDCPYYIDPRTLVPGVSCTVWIKVPTANQTELRMYHCGLASVTSQSNGDDTFDVFDDFLGSTLRTNKWATYIYNTTISVASDIITIAAGSNGATGHVVSLIELPSTIPIITEYSACLYCAESTTWSQVIIGCPASPNSHLSDGDHDYCPIDAGCGFVRTIWGGVGNPSTIVYNGTYANIGDTLVGTYHTYKVNSYGTNNTTAWFYRDGVSIGGVTQVFAQHVAFAAGNGSYGAYASYLRVDWVRVRKYASTEPTLTVTKRQLGEFLKYVVRNHAPVKTLSLYYLCAHHLVTTQYNLKYVIQCTHTPVTKPVSYSIPYIGLTATPTSSEVIPINVSFQVTGASTIPSDWTWTWDFDGDIGSTTTPATSSCSHQFVGYGTYDVTCVAASTSGNHSNTATTSISIVERTKPWAAVYYYIVPTTMLVMFYNYSSGAVSYDWDFGDGTAHSIDTNPTHTFPDISTYEVTLIATNGSGSDTIIKEVIFVHPPPVADFELEYTPLGTISISATVSLTVTDTVGRTDTITKKIQYVRGPFTKFKDLSTGKIKHWEWDFGDIF